MSIGPWVFNILDIIILVVCLISFMWAFSKGFAKELISIFSLLVAIVATFFAWGYLRPEFRKIITESDWIADRVGGLAIFLLTYIILGFLLRNVLGQADRPSFANRLLGGGFGIARGLFIVAVVSLIWNAGLRDKMEMAEQYGAPMPVKGEWFSNSTIYPIVEKIENFLLALPLPEIRSALEKVADGDTKGAIDGIEEVIDGQEE